MLSVFGVQLSFVDVGLSSLLLLSLLIILGAFRRISRLEEKLQVVHVNIARDIKMVNQGSIGIGRRFASIEKTLKKSAKVATYETATHSDSKKSTSKNAASDGSASIGKPSDRSTFSSVSKKVIAETATKNNRSTKAEQALSAWINDHKTA